MSVHYHLNLRDNSLTSNSSCVMNLVVIVLWIIDCLLTQPVDPLEKEMPSPASLKHKIILKARKRNFFIKQ